MCRIGGWKTCFRRFSTYPCRKLRWRICWKKRHSNQCLSITISSRKSESVKSSGQTRTGAKVNGNKWWIWVWQNVLTTFVVASNNRGSQTLTEVWENGLPQATLSSDRWAAQLKFSAAAHQLCLAHLLRDTVYLKEKEKHEFADKFNQLLSKVFEVCKELRARQKSFSSHEGEELENQLNQWLVISIATEKYPETAKFQRAMIKHRNYILPCLYDLSTRQ